MSALAVRSEFQTRQHEIAHAVVGRIFEARPEMEQLYGSPGRGKCLQDTIYHLRYLAEAIEAGSPTLFVEYVSWAKVLLAGYRIPVSDLQQNLRFISATLRDRLTPDLAMVAADFVQRAVDALPSAPEELPSEISETRPHGILAREYLNRLLEGNRRGASALVMNAIEQGATVRDLYLNVFEPSQREIGRLWQCNSLSVAQEHFCTAATQMIMSQLYPRIFSSERNGLTLVATSISGELHEIGIRMVSDFLEMEGWDTFYVGANAPISSIVRTLKERSAHLLAISATMSFHVSSVTDLIRAVRADPGCSAVKIIAGGMPFNLDPGLWRKVGADGSTRDLREVGALAEKLARG
jgi:MerR family transcriptional regulator, light-induced transcriptional regulator